MRLTQALNALGSTRSLALRARVLGRAAYVALISGDAGAARQYAQRAVPIAISEGVYDVATSVYTVLYSLAYEVDDDPAACLDYLASVRDCGAKSGTARIDLHALVATYELCCEAGDRNRLAELDRAICDVDVKYATLVFLESFLPARAMQAAWAGDFGYAHGLLAATAERQGTPLREALRWSEIGLYAAAAGDRIPTACARERSRWLRASYRSPTASTP